MTMNNSEHRWVVLIGGFSGDGSDDHSLFRLEDGETRVPIFTSQAAAENYILTRHLGEFCLLAEVIVEANVASEMTYLKTGRRITATSATQDG
jgi:hypothetical protein